MVWSVSAVTVNAAAVIFADKVGCVKIYFAAAVTLKVYPVVITVISVPTLALAKVNTGEPSKLTSSPDSTPTRMGVPDAVASVVPSYALSPPDNPLMVKVINSVVVTSNFSGIACRFGIASLSSATRYTS